MKSAKNHQEIGKLLKYHRQLQGLSQQELADLAGLSQPAISNIEKGLGGTLGTVEAIMFALKLEVLFEPISKIDKKDLVSLVD
ncbi:helix-turn-helix domain-containing protein [Pseudobdellovibrio exovorus]|uniref:HTH cro/C1-type domain-containing protein n=1 Tax=Pseudobdellovibrio exovorus JSS TaxID=1184267 RepID=M4VTW1_9BACT|nr:helix-turn-helix transcriptional regulator [Pseudobdellovibrio exovorus]AGH96644.1 hypothetical protein A11Q_2428 [Pseudobdellovibrio exovorus JSS]